MPPVSEELGPPGSGAAADLDVVGVGNALVDVLAHVSDHGLAALGLTPGSMTLVDLERAEALYRAMGPAIEVSGGSAANTMAGVVALGGTAGFVGKVADDELGKVFVHDLRAAGVELEPAVAHGSGAPRTGRCHVFVSPGAGRTMATHLGAAETIRPAEIPHDLVARGSVLYLEGYLWDVEATKEAMRQAIGVAHDSGGSVALSLSDPFCVDRHCRELLDLVVHDVDVLFGNEQEITRLFSANSLERALSAAEETGVLVAATRGPAGSIVVTGAGLVDVPAADCDDVVDPTGAGDLYAAGFLYGLTHGKDPEECARLGSLCAAEVIGHLGARPEHDLVALAGSAGLG